MPDNPERRFAALELRSSNGAPGILSGVAVRYGDRAEIAANLFELFEPGAFGPDVAKSTVVVNRQHDRALPLGRGRRTPSLDRQRARAARRAYLAENARRRRCCGACKRGSATRVFP